MELALAFPYSLGLVAAFNPCGFALLPAYLSYFLGLEGDHHEANPLRNVLRGLAVGLTLTAGFIAVFGGFGLLFETVVNRASVLDRIGWATMAIGAGMVALGIWMLLGRQLVLRMPKLNRGTAGRDLGSVFMFGVSYAVVSLSCTIGLFIAAVTSTFSDQGFIDGVVNFIAYGAGMGSVIIFLTLGLALARNNIARQMRRLLPYINRISGLVLVASGSYLINYGWWELRLLDDPLARNAAVEWFTEIQADVSNWIARTTPHRLGLVCLFGVAGALLAAWRPTAVDRIKQRSLGAAYMLAYLVVEIGFNRGDFLAGPLLRFVTSWPQRAGHWFSDPLRFGVPLEVGFTALVGWLLWLVLRRCLPGRPAADRQPRPASHTR